MPGKRLATIIVANYWNVFCKKVAKSDMERGKKLIYAVSWQGLATPAGYALRVQLSRAKLSIVRLEFEHE